MTSKLLCAELLSKVRAYQYDIYHNGMFRNKLLRVSTDASRLEEQAKKHLGVHSGNYLFGGAGELATQDANRAAFKRWQLIPRPMVDTSKRSLGVTLFGQKYASPLIQAPIGVQSIFHQDGEKGLAEACSELGVPFVLSTAASSTIEEVASASGDGPRWFQLYWPNDDEITLSILRRAQESKYSVLVVTLDTWSAGWRPLDLDLGYLPLLNGVGDQIGFSDPVFRSKFRKMHNIEVEDNIQLASREWLRIVLSGSPQSWERISFLKKHWPGPVVVKGIQHPDDAKLAVKAGCDGVIVSNHGGRQLDGAVGSLQMLPAIVDAVGKETSVLFDSGTRTGADILKAFCLGAKAVLIGRPTIYGYAVAGKQGAQEVLMGLLADLDRSMSMSGIIDLQDCDRSSLVANE
ncbi:hypothetical protein TWF481_007361 [Arthrobotrys musiformis]|uniref:FMN hydroxy acid dehydrogenase domain-containing protein n=1 Tax=Arthrobotrys musiformis TaxID=47236 RepID=A0AAV9WC87_9PEZI